MIEQYIIFRGKNNTKEYCNVKGDINANQNQ